MKDPIWLLELLVMYYEEAFVDEDYPENSAWLAVIDALERFRAGDPKPAQEIYMSWARQELPERKMLATSEEELQAITLHEVLCNLKDKRKRALLWSGMARQLQ